MIVGRIVGGILREEAAFMDVGDELSCVVSVH